MDIDDTTNIRRDGAPSVAFAWMPAGSQSLANGPIPEAQLVKIARDVDVAIRQDGEERIVYLYYITQDVQAVADQLREAYEREEIKREARVAIVEEAMEKAIADLKACRETERADLEEGRQTLVELDADRLRNNAMFNRTEREKVQTSYYSVIRQLVNELLKYLTVPDFGPWEPMRLLKARLAEIVNEEPYLIDHLNATRPGFARFINKETINKLLTATWSDSLFLGPEPYFSSQMLLNTLVHSLQTEPFRGDSTPAAAREAIGIFLAVIGKKEATDLIGRLKADTWTRDHLKDEMLLDMAELHDYDPVTWKRPVESWELGHHSDTDSDADGKDAAWSKYDDYKAGDDTEDDDGSEMCDNVAKDRAESMTDLLCGNGGDQDQEGVSQR